MKLLVPSSCPVLYFLCVLQIILLQLACHWEEMLLHLWDDNGQVQAPAATPYDSGGHVQKLGKDKGKPISWLQTGQGGLLLCTSGCELQNQAWADP